jgi:hypothetical protein
MAQFRENVGSVVGCNSEAYYTVSERFNTAQYASLLTPYEKLAPYRVEYSLGKNQ